MKILQTISAVTFLGILSLSGQDGMAMDALGGETDKSDMPVMAPVPQQIGSSKAADEVKEEQISLKGDRAVDVKKLIDNPTELGAKFDALVRHDPRKRRSAIQRSGEAFLLARQLEEERVRNLEKQHREVLDENEKLKAEIEKRKADFALVLKDSMTAQERLDEAQEQVQALKKQVKALEDQLTALHVPHIQG